MRYLNFENLSQFTSSFEAAQNLGWANFDNIAARMNGGVEIESNSPPPKWVENKFKKVIKKLEKNENTDGAEKVMDNLIKKFGDALDTDWLETKLNTWLDEHDIDLNWSVETGFEAPAQSIYSMTLNGTDYVLTFNDEFDSFSANTGHGSGGVWSTSYSPHLDDQRTIEQNGEGQFYVDPDMSELPNPFSVENGVLTIHAHELTPEQQVLTDGQTYASGLMNTELSFGMEGGYIEIRASVPDQQGFLSAFWLLPSDGDWTSEIDVFETLGHNTTTMNTNVWNDGSQNQLSFSTDDLSEGFHTYGLEWTDSEITWYIDGIPVRTVPNTVNEDMYLVLSLAVDTDWTGPVDGTTDFSDGFQVDYIRVYETPSADSNPQVQDGQIIADPLVYGNSDANETLYGTRWADTIEGAGGDDQIFGRDGDDLLFGGDGENRLFGQTGNDVLIGGADRDTINGGDGEDRIEGGGGVDHLWGGTWGPDQQADIFVFGTGDGTDYIHDFEFGSDQIDLSSYAVSWSDLSNHLHDEGWATHLDLSSIGGNAGDGVYIIGANAEDWGADDFILSSPMS